MYIYLSVTYTYTHMYNLNTKDVFKMRAYKYMDCKFNYVEILYIACICKFIKRIIRKKVHRVIIIFLKRRFNGKYIIYYYNMLLDVYTIIYIYY